MKHYGKNILRMEHSPKWGVIVLAVAAQSGNFVVARNGIVGYDGAERVRAEYLFGIGWGFLKENNCE